MMILQQTLRGEVNKQARNGDITQAQADEKQFIINQAEVINKKNIPQITEYKNLSQHQQDKYTLQLLNESLLKKKLENTEDVVLKQAIEKDIKSSEDIRSKIIDNKVFVTDDYGLVEPEKSRAKKPLCRPMEQQL